MPEKLYFAIQDLEKEELTSKVKELRKNNKMPFQKGKFFKVNGRNLVEAKLISKEKRVSQDFILFQDKLYTFRDLHLKNEPLREAVDLGTIDYISPTDFFEKGENYLYKFKELLRYSFVEDFKEKGIEWVGEDKLFRFSAMGVNSSLPKERKVTWTKDTKSQPRTVVTEIMNKKLKQENETRIICFRHLAFFMEIEYYGDWYLSIRPTWCFTNPNNGISKSRFSSGYLAGLKKQENNQAVLNHFLFIANCIKTNLAETDMNYKSKTSYVLKFNEEVLFKNFSPAINDEDWKPRKSKEKKDNSPELLLNF